jgi:hypothetical protein
MKYTEAWASVTNQNYMLKIALVSLSCAIIGLATITLKMAFNKPMIIERGCASSVVNPTKEDHSINEIEQFLKNALSQRFDTNVTPTDGLLSVDELKLRSIEQKELESKQVKQKMILNTVTESADGFKVDSDRIISLGNIRSAFRIQFLVKLESKARSLSNPYGLIIESIKDITNTKDEK